MLRCYQTVSAARDPVRAAWQAAAGSDTANGNCGACTADARPSSPTPTADLSAHTAHAGGREALQSVFGAGIPTIFVTGRAVDKLRSFVPDAATAAAEVVVAGSHGFDVAGHWAGRHLSETVGADTHRPLLEVAAASARSRLSHITGVTIEDCGMSISVHWRHVPEDVAPSVVRLVEEVAAEVGSLVTKPGKCVTELRPAIAWNKGAAVRKLMAARPEKDALLIAIGDDVTDEDTFRVANELGGVSILVLDAATAAAVADRATVDRSELPRATAASLFLRHPGEVHDLLRRLAALHAHA